MIASWGEMFAHPVTVGIVVFTFALVVLVAAIGVYAGWSPRDVHMFIQLD